LGLDPVQHCALLGGYPAGHKFSVKPRAQHGGPSQQQTKHSHTVGDAKRLTIEAQLKPLTAHRNIQYIT
jgi:hypothetical protein